MDEEESVGEGDSDSMKSRTIRTNSSSSMLPISLFFYVINREIRRIEEEGEGEVFRVVETERQVFYICERREWRQMRT